MSTLLCLRYIFFWNTLHSKACFGSNCRWRINERMLNGFVSNERCACNVSMDKLPFTVHWCCANASASHTAYSPATMIRHNGTGWLLALHWVIEQCISKQHIQQRIFCQWERLPFTQFRWRCECVIAYFNRITTLCTLYSIQHFVPFTTHTHTYTHAYSTSVVEVQFAKKI